MTEKGCRYDVSFAAKNESELEGRAFLCAQKRQRTRDPPLGSCTCRARGQVPIPVQNGARVSCKWRIAVHHTKIFATVVCENGGCADDMHIGVTKLHEVKIDYVWGYTECQRGEWEEGVRSGKPG